MIIMINLLMLCFIAFVCAIPESQANEMPLPRSQAPQFTNVNAVVNNEFKQVSLSDYKGKYVVLVFYPFDFTYVCPTELIAFS